MTCQRDRAAPRPALPAGRRRVAAPSPARVPPPLRPLTGCGRAEAPAPPRWSATSGSPTTPVQTLVDESLAAPGARAALPASDYQGDLAAYQRAVLLVQVERLLVAEEAVRRLGILVNEAEVDAQYRRTSSSRPAARRQFAAELASRPSRVSGDLYRRHRPHRGASSAQIGYEQGEVPAADRGAAARARTRQTLPRRSTANADPDPGAGPGHVATGCWPQVDGPTRVVRRGRRAVLEPRPEQPPQAQDLPLSRPARPTWSTRLRRSAARRGLRLPARQTATPRPSS